MLIILFIYYAKTYDANTASSLMFMYLVLNELLFAFSCRNLKKSVLNKNIFTNKKLTIGVLSLLIVQLLIFLTPLSKYFIVDGLNIKMVFITLGICFISFIIGELVKPIYTKLFKDYKEEK